MNFGIDIDVVGDYLKETGVVPIIEDSRLAIKDNFVVEEITSVEKPKITKDILTKLVNFAYADKGYGEIHPKELGFLFELAEELALSEEDMTEILKNGQNKKYQNIVLNHGSEGVLYFIYEIHLSRQDGVITAVERERIYQQAKIIGIWTPKVKIIIDEWLDTLQRDDKKREKIETLHKEIMDSLNYAKLMQDAVLPRKEELEKLLPEYFLWNQPKDIVSGDFSWITKQGDKVILAVADSTGHGVPGALLSFLGISLLDEIVNKISLTTNLYQLVEKVEKVRAKADEDEEEDIKLEIKNILEILKIAKKYNHIDSDDLDPGVILDYLRMGVKKRLKQESEGSISKDGMDISLISLKKNSNGDFESLEFAGAHNSLYVVRDNKLIILPADRFPVGIYDPVVDKVNFTNHRLNLEKDDMIYMFSDGYQDQFGGKKDKKFKIKQLKETLIDISDISVEEQKEILKSNMKNWIGEGTHEQMDDILFMGIRV